MPVSKRSVVGAKRRSSKNIFRSRLSDSFSSLIIAISVSRNYNNIPYEHK